MVWGHNMIYHGAALDKCWWYPVEAGLFPFLTRVVVAPNRQTSVACLFFFMPSLVVSHHCHVSHNPSAWAVPQIQWGKPQGCFFFIYFWCAFVCELVHMLDLHSNVQIFSHVGLVSTEYEMWEGEELWINGQRNPKRFFNLPLRQIQTSVHLPPSLIGVKNLILGYGTSTADVRVKRPSSEFSRSNGSRFLVSL